MRFGVCTSLDNVEILTDAGYDYIDLGVGASLIPLAGEDEFQKIRRKRVPSRVRDWRQSYCVWQRRFAQRRDWIFSRKSVRPDRGVS